MTPAEKLAHVRSADRRTGTRVAYDRGYGPWLSELFSVSITCFTPALADSVDDDGTVVDRGPRGSGSLVVSLDALK